MDEIIQRDPNHITTLAGVTNDSNQFVTMLRVDPTTKRLLVSAVGGGGSQNLEQVLTVGNSTGDLNIVSPNGEQLLGITDGGFQAQVAGITIADFFTATYNDLAGVLSFDADNRTLNDSNGDTIFDYHTPGVQIVGNPSVGSQTFLTNDDLQERLTWSSGGKNYWDMNVRNNVYEFGDTQAGNHAGLFKIDDGAQTTIISGEYNGSFNGTFQSYDFGTGIIKSGDINNLLNGNVFMQDDGNNQFHFDNLTGNTKVGINSNADFSLDVNGVTAIGTPVFSGAGLNDMSSMGSFQGARRTTYTITISATGTPDQIDITKTVGSNPPVTIVSGLSIVALPTVYVVDQGVQIGWTADTGHTLNDSWTVTATPSGIVNSSSAYYLNGELFGTLDSAQNLIIGGNSLSNFISGASGNISVGQNNFNNLLNSTGNIGIGYNVGESLTGNGNNIFIGTQSDTSDGMGNQVAIGTSTLTKRGAFVSGSDDFNITDVYFANGFKSNNPINWTLHGTDGEGMDVTGGDISIAGGASTGNGPGGRVLFQYSDAGSSGTSSNILINKAFIDQNGFNFADGTDLVFGQTIGSMIGTNVNQLIGFFGATPVAQQSGDIPTALSNLGLVAGGTFNTLSYNHTIFTPTTGGTVNLVNNQNNIINPAGTLLALTVNLPSTPANGDVVLIKYTKAITTVTYSGGTVSDGVVSPVLGTLVTLTFDSGTSTWY